MKHARFFAFDILKTLARILPESLAWRLKPKLRSLAQSIVKPCPSRIQSVTDGFKMNLDPAEKIPSHIAFEGMYEPGLRNLIKKTLHPGDHFLDIGSNIGYFSCLARSIVGPTGKVSVLEANPSMATQVKENLELNGWADSVDIHEIAAWNKEETLTFNLAPIGKSGMGSVRDLSEINKSIEVEALPLDQIFSSDNKKISAIKIDVEGAETQVIEGAKKVIQRDKPVIFIELSDQYLKQLGSSADQLLGKLIKGLSYKVHKYDNSGNVSSFNPRGSSFQENLVCYPSNVK